MLTARLIPLFLMLKACLVVVLSLGSALLNWLRPSRLRRTFRVRRSCRLRLSQHVRIGGAASRLNRGFTLIEIGVVLMIVATLVGLAIPTISSIAGIQAKAEVNKLASNIRAARGHAAVSGQTCRMVFDLEGGSYNVECTKGQVQVAAETSLNGARQTTLKDDKPDKDLTESERMKRKILNRIQFASSKALPPQKLKGHIAFDSIWTAHQEDKYTKGQAYLYFFPSGTTETANIVMKYGDDFYTVQVSPLAGKVTILGKKADPPGVTNDDY